jgi:hypothetical protein
MTSKAVRALNLADAFQAAFRPLHLAPLAYAAELTAPDGPSTVGGALALQHVRLVPSNPDHPTLLVGGANANEGIAQLRSYDFLDATHRERFGTSIQLSRTHYGQLLFSLRRFFTLWGLKVEIVDLPGGAAAMPALKEVEATEDRAVKEPAVPRYVQRALIITFAVAVLGILISVLVA